MPLGEKMLLSADLPIQTVDLAKWGLAEVSPTEKLPLTRGTEGAPKG